MTRRAFTSIELLVAMGVMVILASAATPAVMASLRRNAVVASVNGVVGLADTARSLAMATEQPMRHDPTWRPDDRFGVAFHRRDDGRYEATLTRGADADPDRPWTDARRGESSRFVLPAGVMVLVAAGPGDEPVPLAGDLGWTFAYRSGATRAPGVSGDPCAVGLPGSAVAERILLRSIDGELEASFAVHGIGLAHGGEVRER